MFQDFRFYYGDFKNTKQISYITISLLSRVKNIEIELFK